MSRRARGSRRFVPHEQLPAFPVLTTQNATQQLIFTLEVIVDKYPPTSRDDRARFSGFWSGPTGIAYLFLRLSTLASELPLIKGKTCLQISKEYLSSRRVCSPPDASNCGILNEALAYCAVSACVNQSREAANEVLRHLDKVCSEGDGSDEWLYGRAGYLYFLRMIQIYVPDAVPGEKVEKVVQKILESKGRWKWHGKEYIGAVHGDWGIVTQVLLSAPSYASELQDIVKELLEITLPSGNWPSSRSSSRDDMVQFCHGAPGALAAIYSIRHLYPHLEEQIDAAIRGGTRCVWERGILTKEPCLCHGTSGNALVLPPDMRMNFMSLVPEEEVQEQIEDGDYEGSSHPEGLLTGMAGRAWAWYVASKEEGSLFIGFNDL